MSCISINRACDYLSPLGGGRPKKPSQNKKIEAKTGQACIKDRASLTTKEGGKDESR